MILTKMIDNKINYKVILSLEFGINLLTPSKNRARYTAEDKHVVHNRVKDNTAHNRTVEAEMTFRVVASLSLQALETFFSPGHPPTFSPHRLMQRINVYEVDGSSW